MMYTARIAFISILLLFIFSLLTQHPAKAQTPESDTKSFSFQGTDGWFNCGVTNCYSGPNVAGRLVNGDFNGDGRADIAALYDYGNAKSVLHVWLSTGSTFSFQGDSGWWQCPTDNCYSGPNVEGKLVAGDFNGDGKDDIAALYDYGNAKSVLHVWLSTGSAFSFQGTNGWWQCPTQNCYSGPNIAGRLVAGDFNNDGKDDIAALYDYGNARSVLHVWLSTGSAFSFQGTNGWWQCSTENCYSGANAAGRLVSGDFNGDGRADIAALYDYGNARSVLHVWLSTGLAFSFQGDSGWWQCVSENCYSGSNVPGRIVSGDFNGDGRADIATLYDYGNARATLHTWLSTGFSFSFQGTGGWWQCPTENCYSAPNVEGRLVAGDFNKDGRSDIAALYDYGNASSVLHTWLSSNSLPSLTFDLTISLYNSPTDHTPYIRILEEYADAIFEMSNGVHKVGTITIYQNGQNNNSADVVWVANVWPSVPGGCISGQGKPGCKVNFGDTFSFPTPYVAIQSSNWRGAGYALGHEWGHYYYGIYDEYSGSATCDDATKFFYPQTCDSMLNSVMNSQWNAVNGNYNWLNFGIAPNQTRHNITWRVYGASGWEVLARSPNQDPRDGSRRSTSPRRYFPELASVAPSNGATSSIQLPTAEARSALHIVWVNPVGASLASERVSESTYIPVVRSVPSTGILYPESAVLIAHLAKEGGFVINAEVTATISAPSNATTKLILKDDGKAPDAESDDGIYSASWLYYENGQYKAEVRFSNPSGGAKVTYVGNHYTPGPNGEENSPATKPITDSFSELSAINVIVAGYPPSTGAPVPLTRLIPDNRDYPGRVDGVGDKDTFVLSPTQTGEIALRLTDFDLGMQARIKVFKGEANPVLIGEYQFSPQDNRYFFTKLNAQSGDMFTVEVSHVDSTAVTGLYNISAGPALPNTLEQPLNVYLPFVRR